MVKVERTNKQEKNTLDSKNNKWNRLSIGWATSKAVHRHTWIFFSLKSTTQAPLMNMYLISCAQFFVLLSEKSFKDSYNICSPVSLCWCCCCCPAFDYFVLLCFEDSFGHFSTQKID